MSMETLFFEKKWMLHFQRKNLFGPFFSFYRVWETSSNKFWESKSFCDSYWTSHKIISLWPTRSMETIYQKRLFSRGKTSLGNSFSYHRVWQTSSNVLLGSTRYSGYLFARYRIFSLTPRRLLKTPNFLKKKDYFSSEKIVSANFFSYYRVWQTSRNKL